jgi:hypothetical protein
MTEREHESIRKQGACSIAWLRTHADNTELDESMSKPKPQPRNRTSLKRLAERKMRKKRRAMLEESRSSMVLHAESPSRTAIPGDSDH